MSAAISCGIDTRTQNDGKKTTTVSIGGCLSLNSVGMFRRMASLDIGTVLLPEHVFVDELANGKLRPTLPRWDSSAQLGYAMTGTRLMPAKTQRFIDFLRERLI